MKAVYTSCYGKIVKQCPGLDEYWYKGKLIVYGRGVCASPDPRDKPTLKDWRFCRSLVNDAQNQQNQGAKNESR